MIMTDKVITSGGAKVNLSNVWAADKYSITHMTVLLLLCAVLVY